MKILIVDDDSYKIENIKKLLLKINSTFEIFVEKALNPGLKTIYNDVFDLIILDMSMPRFSVTESQNFDSFGGITFLKEMRRRRVTIPTIILTQYEIFGEGNSQKTSDTIDEECKDKFENYKGLIIYSSIDNSWKEKLVISVGEILNGKDFDC